MSSTPPPMWVPPTHPAPPERPELPDGVAPTELRPSWPAWTAWAALLAALAAATVLGGIVLVIGGGSAKHPAAGASIVATLLQDGCFIGAAWVFAGMGGRRPRPEQFGLRPPRRPAAAAGLVVAGYAAFILFSGIWLTLLGRTDTSDDLPDQLGADKSTVALIAVAFLVAVVAPVAEEFLFRGYFFTALRNWRGLWPAALITGLVFGGIHGASSPAVFLVPLAAFGVVLCLLYARTGSLYPCIALHCINNSIALGSSMKWSWQIPVTMVCALALIALALDVVRRRSATDRPAPAPA